MKTRIFSLIIAAVYSFSALPVQAQDSLNLQGLRFQKDQAFNQPSVFSANHLSLSNPAFDNTIKFERKSIELKYSNAQSSFFKAEKPLNIFSTGISTLGIGYGVIALHTNKLQALNLSTKSEIREDHPFFHTHIDNYLQFSPAAVVIGLNLAGVHGEHSFKDELFVYGISSVIMIGAVRSLKPLTHELRPDGSAYNSFPSGHTATAFAAAEWLRMEYWHKSPWIGVAGYAVATSIGVLRVYNNRHWVSDVIAGAAIGFLSTRIAYAVYPWIKTHIFHSHYDYTADF